MESSTTGDDSESTSLTAKHGLTLDSYTALRLVGGNQAEIIANRSRNIHLRRIFILPPGVASSVQSPKNGSTGIENRGIKKLFISLTIRLGMPLLPVTGNSRTKGE